MKKLVFLFTIILAFCLTSFGQGTHINVKADKSLFSYNGLPEDTLLVASPYTRYKIITITDPGFYNYNIDVDVDSAGDGGGVTVALQGRINSLDDWATITSVSWTGASDTVITFTNATDYTTAQTVSQYTITTAAFNVLQDTTGMQYYFPDTIKYPAQTQTVAAQTITNTVTQGGVIWPELRILFTGSDATADISLDDIVGIINRKKSY